MMYIKSRKVVSMNLHHNQKPTPSVILSSLHLSPTMKSFTLTFLALTIFAFASPTNVNLEARVPSPVVAAPASCISTSNTSNQG